MKRRRKISFGSSPSVHLEQARKSLALARMRVHSLETLRLQSNEKYHYNFHEPICKNAIEEYGHWSSNMSTAKTELEHAGQTRRSAQVATQQAKTGSRLRSLVRYVCDRRRE